MKNYTGLNDQQVEKSRAEHGSNALSQKEKESFWSIFFDSFKDKWIIILLVALVLELGFYFLGRINPELGTDDWQSAVFIFFVVMTITIVGSLIQNKQNIRYSALQDQASKIFINVFRNGKIAQMSIDDAVVNDEILIQTGDMVPVDGIILEVEKELKVNQAQLNGESDDAEKMVLGNNKVEDTKDTYSPYLLFRGSVVTAGAAVIKATTVGDATMLGEINASLQEEDDRKTPAEVKLDKLANQIGVFGYVGGGLAAGINLILGIIDMINGGGFTIGGIAYLLLASIILGVSIVVMAVPEGLPLMNTMVQGLNVGKMYKDNIFVKNPKATETAGSLDLLFTDKTGTLTYGKQVVSNIVTGDCKIYEKFEDIDASIREKIIVTAGLNNDAKISSDGEVIGSNPTDKALMRYLALDNKVTIDDSHLVDKEQFNSKVKYASVTLDDGYKYIKGAPDIIVNDACDSYLDVSGKIVSFDKKSKEALWAAVKEQTSRAMRLIGAVMEDKTGKRTLICLFSIRDDVRSDVNHTVKKLNKAGVQVCMVTGDVYDTAVAIAKEAGLISSPDDIAITHAELEAMSDEKLLEILPHLKVVSRALPSDKLRLVTVSQSVDHVVGMTGDGVNDAPALKKADVGFAMGDGTEVAKEAGDIVILNNSLTSIASAILYGRTMSKSVKKFIIFQLTVNVSTVIIAVLAPLTGWAEPFIIVQILWINMIMDTLAAIAFGTEPALERYMDEMPIARTAPILTPYLKSAIGACGIFIALGSLIILNMPALHTLLRIANNEGQIRTFMFSFFIFAIIWNSLNARTDSMNLFEHIGDNKNFLRVMGAITIVQTLIIEVGGDLFGTTGLSLPLYLAAFGMAAIILVVDECRKAVLKSKNMKP